MKTFAEFQRAFPELTMIGAEAYPKFAKAMEELVTNAELLDGYKKISEEMAMWIYGTAKSEATDANVVSDLLKRFRSLQLTPTIHGD